MMLKSEQKRRRQSGWRNDLPLTVILLFLAFLTYVPFAFILISSFKSNQQFFTQFWLPSWPLHLENYLRAWPPIWRSVQYSALYSGSTLLLVLSVSGLAGYAFARYRFWGKEALFVAILALIMLPGILLVIPMFTQIVSWGWLDTLQGVVLPWTAIGIVIGIYLMRVFFESLPKEYFEAARLDGASELQLFYRIAVPLALPAFGTLAILDLLFTWNDLIWPLVVIQDSERLPVSVGVLTFTGMYGTEYGVTFAGYVMASVPLLIVFALTAQRFIAGLQGSIR